MSLLGPERRRDWFAIGGLVVLSALWAAAWLRADLVPRFGTEAFPLSVSQAILFSLFAAISAAVALVRRVAFARGRRAWAIAAFGVGLFVLPAALTALANGWVSKVDQVAIFSLTPVFAVVLEPYLQGERPRQGTAALLGALAAVCGVLCLFPLDVPGSPRAAVGICTSLLAAFAVATANCIGVRLAGGRSGTSVLPMAAVAGAASAVCFGVAAGITQHQSWGLSAGRGQVLSLLATDLPALFLLFWLMSRMSASRMSSRFLLAPLFALLGGIALEPAALPLRAIIGMVLLAGGAGWLVLAPPEKNGTEALRVTATRE